MLMVLMTRTLVIDAATKTVSDLMQHKAMSKEEDYNRHVVLMSIGNHVKKNPKKPSDKFDRVTEQVAEVFTDISNTLSRRRGADSTLTQTVLCQSDSRSLYNNNEQTLGRGTRVIAQNYGKGFATLTGVSQAWNENSRVVLCISGHGSKRGAIVVGNERAFITDLWEVLKVAKFARMILIVDTCYSGKFLSPNENRPTQGTLAESKIANMFYAKNVVIWTVSQYDEIAYTRTFDRALHVALALGYAKTGSLMSLMGTLSRKFSKIVQSNPCHDICLELTQGRSCFMPRSKKDPVSLTCGRQQEFFFTLKPDISNWTAREFFG